MRSYDKTCYRILKQCPGSCRGNDISRSAGLVTLYVLNFSEGTKHIFTFTTRTYLFYIVNIMGADVAASLCKSLYLDMHGLIIDTSICI